MDLHLDAPFIFNDPIEVTEQDVRDGYSYYAHMVLSKMSIKSRIPQSRERPS